MKLEHLLSILTQLNSLYVYKISVVYFEFFYVVCISIVAFYMIYLHIFVRVLVFACK